MEGMEKIVMSGGAQRGGGDNRKKNACFVSPISSDNFGCRFCEWRHNVEIKLEWPLKTSFILFLAY